MSPLAYFKLERTSKFIQNNTKKVKNLLCETYYSTNDDVHILGNILNFSKELIIKEN